ncbi:hypothetical protein LGH70_02235 [Hymenobacter sp. BT635]|uniref:Uncharacterized protein n=1 Tax=Hymenobacter nitidus TaxID=2880929 RepID=A0ABS8A7U6_9BACT|nr:hypothetical protein [Hymenobacter nitidus]MCB2376381.1 hypothetical protein [Hymenobacter nitidus]
MDPTRNPAEDADFDFDAWVRWQNLKQAWTSVQDARQRAARPRPAVAPEPAFEPEIVYLLPVPN